VQLSEVAEVDGELEPARFDAILNLLRDGTGEAGSITAARRELGWRAEWFGSAMTASVVPADGRTSIRITQRIRGLAAATITSVTAIAGLLAPVASVVSFEIMRMPTPRWARSLGLDLFVHRSDREVIAIGVGIALMVASIPVGRWINRILKRQHERRLHLLTEAVTANVRLAVNEDKG
jgi:hypothetical protein